MPIEDCDLRIENFDPARHDRDGFSCGVQRLDNYLKRSANKQQKGDMVRVYVAVEDGSKTVLGYHAINLGRVNVDALPKRPRTAPGHGELPVLFLGQVAVSERAQGQGIGSILMHHVFEKACRVAEEAGCFAIVLDVIKDGGDEASERRRSWYEEFGFQSFASDRARMFMAMKQVRAVTATGTKDVSPSDANG